MAAIGIHLLIFLPLAGAIIVWALPERRKDGAPAVSLVVGLITFVLGLLLWLTHRTLGGLDARYWKNYQHILQQF